MLVLGRDWAATTRTPSVAAVARSVRRIRADLSSQLEIALLKNLEPGYLAALSALFSTLFSKQFSAMFSKQRGASTTGPVGIYF